MIFSSHSFSKSLYSSSSSSSSSSQYPSKTQTLQNLLKSGFSPTIQTLNLFLSFLLKNRKLQLVLHVFSQISSNSIEIGPQTHSLVDRALLEARRFEEAHEFISNTEKFDFSPKKGLWDSLIRGICVVGGSPENALSLLNECVRNRGIFPSPITFRSLVFSFSSQGKMDRAIAVLETMSDAKIGHPLDNFVCSSIISGFCKVGKSELGLGFYESVVRTHGFQPNLITYTAVVDALCREGRIDEVCDLVRTMEKEGVVLDAVLYGCWVCGYFREGLLVEGLRKHRLMVESGIKPDIVSYTILIDGLCEEGNVEKVIGFLKEMEKRCVKPNLVTYTAIMRGFCKRSKLEEAFCVVRKVEELGIRVDEFMYSILIDGLCRKRDLDGVFNLLEEMERKGLEAGSVTYNTVINGLCKAGKTCQADEISKGFFGDNFTYSTLLHGYMKEKDVAGVMETKRRLEKAGISMDVVTCNVLIKALFMVGVVEDAFFLFKEMSKMGLVADSVTYCTMVDGCCKLGMVDKALEVFDEYRKNSSLTNAASHNCIIRGLCKEHMVEMANEVFQDLIGKGLNPDSITYRLLIKAHFDEGNGEGVWKFIHGMEKLEPDLLSSIGNDAVAFLCSKGCFVAALDVYILMRRRGLVVTSKSYYVILKSLIRGGNKQLIELMMNGYIKECGSFEPRVINVLSLYLCKKDVEEAIQFPSGIGKKKISVSVLTAVVDSLKRKGRVQDAQSFLMEHEENGVNVDVVVYSIVVDGLCKEGYLEKALDLCASMRKKGIHPNIVIYNSVINGLCLQGCLVEAFRLFDSLEHNNILPSVITYATLIGALAKEGFLQDARQLFERMTLKGIGPNTRIFNFLINGYCSFGLLEEALKLLLDLEQSGLQPDAFTVSVVINGCCLRGDTEGALGFFMEYKRRGFTPDFLGFMNLINALYAKGRMEETRSILKDMLQCKSVIDLLDSAGDEINEEPLVVLLGLLCEQGRIQDVVGVLSEVGSMNFPSCRFSSDNRSKVFKRLHETDAFDTGVGGIDFGKGGTHPMVVDLPKSIDESLESKYLNAGIVDMNSRFCKIGKEDNGVKEYEHLLGKPLWYDFDTNYSILASLCSKGELQKANSIVKAMLLNSEEYC